MAVSKVVVFHAHKNKSKTYFLIWCLNNELTIKPKTTLIQSGYVLICDNFFYLYSLLSVMKPAGVLIGFLAGLRGKRIYKPSNYAHIFYWNDQYIQMCALAGNLHRLKNCVAVQISDHSPDFP